MQELAENLATKINQFAAEDMGRIFGSKAKAHVVEMILETMTELLTKQSTNNKFDTTRFHQEEVGGLKFIELVENTKEESGSGSPEMLLLFENGKEILIFQHINGTIHLETD